jgi:G2/mitotic-specific cyclin-B, other
MKAYTQTNNENSNILKSNKNMIKGKELQTKETKFEYINKDTKLFTTNKRPLLGEINPNSTNNKQQKVNEKKETKETKEEMKTPGIQKMFTVMQIQESPHIDLNEKENVQFATEYVKDIFDYFKNNETKHICKNPNYMELQSEINFNMRGILVDWIVEVHLKYTLLPETLYLAVNLIDRFLSLKNVSKSKLQLLGVTALFVASKYEEIYPPDADDFINVTANSYSREDLFKMEKLLLITLEFNCTVASSFIFLERYTKIIKSNEKIKQMAHYFSELCLLEHVFLKYKPSIIAASSVYLAQKFDGNNDAWNEVCVYYSGYKKENFRDCARLILALVKEQNEENQKPSIFKKYALKVNHEVSLLAKEIVTK